MRFSILFNVDILILGTTVESIHRIIKHTTVLMETCQGFFLLFCAMHVASQGSEISRNASIKGQAKSSEIWYSNLALRSRRFWNPLLGIRYVIWWHKHGRTDIYWCHSPFMDYSLISIALFAVRISRQFSSLRFPVEVKFTPNHTLLFLPDKIELFPERFQLAGPACSCS